MAETTLKIVPVFIGSPGGLETERRAAKCIVNEINQSHAENWGCQIKLVGWEATLAGYSRAQSLINQDLDKCDYFIGVIWNHWGSKPSNGRGKFTSGFEEEFERAKDRIEKGQMKDIALFFKEIPEVQQRDRGPSVDKVIKFRDKCIKKRKLLFKEFKESSDFETLFRAAIVAIGWQEFQATKLQARKDLEPEQPANAEDTLQEQSNGSDKLFGESSAKFLNLLIKRSDDWDATDAYEAARLRLIALSVNRSGNNEMYLGVHDANLLFVKRADFDFDKKEIRALIDAGIAGFHHQNVPLWNWMATSVNSEEIFRRARSLAVFGNEMEKPNAIRLLQCAGEKTPAGDEFFGREAVLTTWLTGETSDKSFTAALKFLSTNGESEDLKIVEGFVDQVPKHRKGALATTVISLLTSTDLSKAFERLIELDPDKADEVDVSTLFARPKSVPTATLERCLRLKSDNIRKVVAALLSSRRAIDIQTAEKLLTDTDFEVRLIGIESLLQQGVSLPEETIRAALIRYPPNPPIGLFGFGNPGLAQADKSFYERYQQSRLSKLSYDELRKKGETSGFLDYLEVTTLYARYTGRCLTEIRNNLSDGFKSYFQDKIARLATLYPDESTYISDAKSLEDHMCTRLTSKTLEALCAYSGVADIELVRKTLDDWHVEYADNILRYLGRFGDWSDINRILSIGNPSSGRSSLLSFAHNKHDDAVASALYALGKSCLIDLLDLKADTGVRSSLIKKFSQKDISSLSDDILIDQMNSTDDQFRKGLALKCALSLTQARIRKLLDRYTTRNGQRYYNSIHWLDLGASMPSRIAKMVAIFELARLQ